MNTIDQKVQHYSRHKCLPTAMSGACLLRAVALCCTILVLMLPLAACSKVTASPESASTLAYWRTARSYQAEGRHELAKQYFLLALAGSRSSMSQSELQTELEASNRMLQTMR